jgi:hypothetical protein
MAKLSDGRGLDARCVRVRVHKQIDAVGGGVAVADVGARTSQHCGWSRGSPWVIGVGTRIVVDERAVGDERRDVEDLGIVVAILSEGSAGRIAWVGMVGQSVPDDSHRTPRPRDVEKSKERSDT